MLPKNERLSASAESGSPFTRTELDGLAGATTAGYKNFGELSYVLNNGKTLKASDFNSSFTLSFGGMPWWPVFVKADGDNIILTLWLKNSIGEYSFSDGTYGANPTYASNNYYYSWIRSAINMGQTTTDTDPGDYYGSWPNSPSSTSGPTKYNKDTPSGTASCAPSAFKAFASILENPDIVKYIEKGGDYGDYLWLPSLDEVKPGGSWDCTSDQLANLGDTGYGWTRTAYPSSNHFAYQLGENGAAYNDYVKDTLGIRPAINVKIPISGTTVTAPTATDKNTETYTGDFFEFPVTYDSLYVDVTVAGKTFGDADIPVSTADIVGGKLKVKLAGIYTVTLTLNKTAQDNDMQWRDAKGGTDKREFTFTINRAQLDDPTFSDKTYDGTKQTFSLNTTNFKANTDSLPSGMTYNATDNNFEATNAGDYVVKIGLADPDNYCWTNNAVTEKDFKLVINKAALTVEFTPSSNSWDIGQGEKETITVTENSENPDVKLVLSYKDSTGAENNNGFSQEGASYVFDTSVIETPGTYTLVAKLDTTNNAPMNGNYQIKVNGVSVTYAEQEFTITAGKVNLGNVTLQYKQNTTNAAWTAYSDGAISYDIDSNGDAVEWCVQLYNLPKYVVVDTSKNTNGFTDGYKENVGTDAKTYTVTVALRIADDYKDDYVFEDGGTEYEYTAEWTIAPKEIDFTKATWSFSTDGTTWTDFSDKDYPIYTGAAITVKISEKWLENLGVKTGDVKISYQNANQTSANVSTTTSANVTILNGNFKRATNDVIQYSWIIHRKPVTLKDWSGEKNITAQGKSFTFPAVTFADAGEDYSQYIEYFYDYTVNGVSYTDRTKEEMIADVYPVASSTNRIDGTIKVQIADKYKNQYELISDNCLTFEFFTLGDSKIMVHVELIGNGSEYGSVTFGIKAFYYELNDETTDALDFIALAGRYLQLTITDSQGQQLVVTADDVSGVAEFVANAGMYTVELSITNDSFSKTYAVDTPIFFTVNPKGIALPTVKDITFSGAEINLVDYLDGSYLQYSDIITLGGDFAGFRNVSKTDFVATLTITDPNYCWAYPESDVTVKMLVGHSLTSGEFAKLNDSVCSLSWNIAPIVVDTTNLWNKTAKGATLNLPQSVQALISAGTLDVTYRYYDTDGTFVEQPEIKGGASFKVEAVLGGTDAEYGNVVFRQTDGSYSGTSPQAPYTVPQSGLGAAWGKAMDFFKGNGPLGLPVWAWFLIGLALLILLIIIIVVAAKRRKNKEERLAKKEAKEEERRRREEERQMQREKLEAERELAKAKQEAELEKIRAQAGLGMGAASMAMQQPVQQQMPVPQQQPVQQQMPQYQQPVPQYQQMPMAMPQQMPMPQMSGGSGGGLSFAEMMSMMTAQFAGYKADSADKEIASLKNDKEITALRHELEKMQTKLDQLNASGVKPAPEAAVSSAPATDHEYEKIVAVATAVWRNMQAQAQQPQQVQTMPAPQSEAAAVYPPDAVVTTTTTVDTTKNKPVARSREEDSNFDVDGFYDKYE